MSSVVSSLVAACVLEPVSIIVAVNSCPLKSHVKMREY